jgi:SAM-dependent methyltransferase
MKSSAFYDEVANTYSYICSLRKKYNDAVDNYIKSHNNLNDFTKVLDVGSGGGERITRLFPNFTSITAVEESKEMCKILRTNKKIQCVIESNSEKLRVSDFDRNYDLITMQWNVLGHVKTPVTLLKLFYEILDSKGILIFDVNNPLNFRHYGLKSFCSNYFYFFFYPREKRRVFDWTIGELQTPVSFSPTRVYVKWLRSVGFKNVKVTYIDYKTGEKSRPLTGQILIEASKG